MIGYVLTDVLVGTTVLGLLSWVGGIILLAANRDLYRLMEGYGDVNPIRLFASFEKRRYQNITRDLESLDDEYRECYKVNKAFPENSRAKRNQVMRQLAEEFPDAEEYLLPTPFGNVLRSFEIYPRVMYGLEAIDGWGRLLAVIPKDYLDLVDAAKAHVDFWINLGLAFFLLLVEYVSVVEVLRHPIDLWVILVLLVLGTIAPLRATSSAREWGDYVKSAFDMFAPRMRESLDIPEPKDRQEEKRQWTRFSQAIVYRLPDVMPELRKKDIAQRPKRPKRR